MNTLSTRGQISAFFRAKWVELLFAFPAWQAAPLIYKALAVPFMPSDRIAAERFEHAIYWSSEDVGSVAFFGVIAFVILRWRARGPPRVSS